MRKKFSIRSCAKAFTSSIWLFIKQLYVFAFFYGYMLVVALGVSIAIPYCLHRLGLSQNACETVFRILLTITPVLPTAYYSYLSQESMCDEEEFNSGLGFSVWIIIIIYAWAIR